MFISYAGYDRWTISLIPFTRVRWPCEFTFNVVTEFHRRSPAAKPSGNYCHPLMCFSLLMPSIMPSKKKKSFINLKIIEKKGPDRIGINWEIQLSLMEYMGEKHGYS